MKRVLLDTCVFSYVFKGDSRALAYRPFLEDVQPALCFVTVAELYRWALERRWSAKRIALLKHGIAQCETIVYDDELGWEWARLMAARGRPMSSGDAWIAACALRHSLPLVTHNRSDFAHVSGLELISMSGEA